MKFNKQGEQEVSFTCIVSVPASPLHHALMSSETPFPLLPSFEGDRDYNNLWKKSNKVNNFNPKTVSAQFIYHRLGEPDEKSLEHQMKGNKVRVVKGKIDRGMAMMQFPEEFIMAQVLSKVHDSISGKLEGVSFTYASNDLNFKAKWAYGRNKFVVLTD